MLEENITLKCEQLWGIDSNVCITMWIEMLFSHYQTRISIYEGAKLLFRSCFSIKPSIYYEKEIRGGC